MAGDLIMIQRDVGLVASSRHNIDWCKVHGDGNRLVASNGAPYGILPTTTEISKICRLDAE